jgi:hypothetical protein
MNGSQLTRFLPTIASTSFSYVSPGVLDIRSNGTINVTFATQYLITLGATAGGTIAPAPGSSWIGAGTMISITATPSNGFYFVGWNATGAGSVAGRAPSISPSVNSPISETAQFLPIPTRAPAVYSLAVTEAGLPAGVNWSLSTGTSGAGAATTTLTLLGLNGSYSLTVPVIYDAAGTTRYVPDNASWNQSVTSNSTARVSFHTEYLLTVTGSIGGTVSAGGWEEKGTVVTLTATPSGPTWVLSSWNGTGSGSTSGTSATVTVTMTGPVTELASFAPVYPPAVTSGSSTAGESTALLLLVALAAAGLVIGLLVGRRRPPASGAAEWDSSPPASPNDGGASMDSGGDSPPTEEGTTSAAADPPIYDEGPA